MDLPSTSDFNGYMNLIESAHRKEINASDERGMNIWRGIHDVDDDDDDDDNDSNDDDNDDDNDDR